MAAALDERRPATGSDEDAVKSPAVIAPAEASAGDRPAPMGGPLSPSHRLLTVGLLLTVAAWAFEALAVATILPATVDDLGGLTLYGWVFGAFMLTNLVGTAVAGGEVDRLGPARPFSIGIALFVAGLLIGGFAPTMPVLIAGRAVQGLGSGVLGSVAYSVVGRGYPEAARPRMLALMSSAWVIPGLVGPGLAGLIAEAVGWRWVFFGILPFPLLAVVLATGGIRSIPRGASAPAATSVRDWGRIRDAVRLALGMTALLAGLGRSNPLVALPLLGLGAAVALPPLRRLLPPGTLRGGRGPAAAVAAMALLNLGFFGVEAFVPLALTDVRDRGTVFAGLALTSATLTWTAGSWVLDRLARRGNRRRLVRGGLALIAVGIGGVALVLVPSVPVLVVPLAWGVGGLGIGLAYSTIQLVILESAPLGQEGTATSAMQLANTAGIALGTGVGGALIAAFSTGDEASATSLAVQIGVMAAVIGLAFVVAGRLPAGRREPGAVPTAPVPDAAG